MPNLFQSIPDDLPDELQELLAEGEGTVRIERIVSRGHTSPPDFWYDQEEREWVVLLSGSATLQFEDEPHPHTLQPGDWLNIAPHRRHRVQATAADGDTVWLAVFFG